MPESFTAQAPYQPVHEMPGGFYFPLGSDIHISEGTVLLDSGGHPVTLGRQSALSNGAVIYDTDLPGVQAKIYNISTLSSFYEQKVRRMLEDPVDIPGVLWPKDVLADQHGVFRGYLMDTLSGRSLLTFVFKPDALSLAVPSWKRSDLCLLAETVLDMIIRLHRCGILLGCINPSAIRVLDPSHAVFSDTDEFQVEGFPCLYTNYSFTAPEDRSRLSGGLYLVSEDGEAFSVSVLLFMILMAGKSPYLTKKDAENANFPFFTSDQDPRNRSIAVMPGVWRYMWSHLTPDIKAQFVGVFQNNQRYNRCGSRPSLSSWRPLLEELRTDLSREPRGLFGFLRRKTGAHNRLFPDVFFYGKDTPFSRCEVCGREHPDFFFDEAYLPRRICNECMERPSDVSYTCVDCHRTYIYNWETALFHERMREKDASWRMQKHCPECKSKKEPCRSCGSYVSFYLLNSGFCPECFRAQNISPSYGIPSKRKKRR